MYIAQQNPTTHLSRLGGGRLARARSHAHVGQLVRTRAHTSIKTRMLVNLSARARTRASRRKCASRQLTFRNHKTKKLETKAHHSNPRMFRVSHRLSTKMLLFRGHPHSNHKIGSSSKVRGTLFAQWPCPWRAVEPKLPSSAPWQSVCELPCRQQGWGGTASPSLFVERTTTAPSRFL